MDIDKVLRNLSDSLGLPPLTLDANRACAFLVDDELHTELRYDERADVLCLYAEVGRARPVEQSQLIQTLLETNAILLITHYQRLLDYLTNYQNDVQKLLGEIEIKRDDIKVVNRSFYI